MSRFPRPIILAGAGVMAVFGPALLAAAEGKTPAPASVTAASADPIAGARKELEGLKLSGDSVLPARGEVPRLSMPEWQGPSSSPPGPSATLKAPTLPAKSARWLLDAMEKQPAPRSAKGSTERERDSGSASPLQAREKSETNDSRRSPESRDEKEMKPNPGAANPLARFLGDWMTPQDYALLKPGLKDSAGSEVSSKNPLGQTASGTMESALGVPGANATRAMEVPIKPGFVNPVRRENPYLQTLERPEPAIALLPSGPKPVANAPAPPPPAPYVAPPLVPQSRVPDFAKPLSDEKYFRPLKRF